MFRQIISLGQKTTLARLSRDRKNRNFIYSKRSIDIYDHIINTHL